VDSAEDLLSPALESTLRRFADEVRHTALRFGLAGDEVDELEQEMRLRLWKALRTGEKIEAAPASYLQRVARSAAIDMFRRRRARREEPIPEAGAHEPMAAPPVEAQLEHEDLTRALAEAISGLVASRQGVVRMYLAGYPREAIADLMGWSEPKTRNLLYRGLEDLRQRLTAMGISPEAAS
jgi:RNA polymerase sigma-70 factor (ECF subfamily)